MLTYVQVYEDWRSRMLTYADVCTGVRGLAEPHVDVCCRMLTYVQVYEDWRSRLGETALETVKAITMLGKNRNVC